MSAVSIHSLPRDLIRFRRVYYLNIFLTGAWQQLMLDSDSELYFDGFVSGDFVENEKKIAFEKL